MNLLIAYGGWREDTFAQLLPHVLSPLGVRCLRAQSAREAERVIRTAPIHIVVVDVTLPMDESSLGREPAGTRVMELLRRLDQPPPTVVVRPRQPSLRDQRRGLIEALHHGAFAVMDRPFPIESMLGVLRDVLNRHYGDRWPNTSAA